MQAVRDALQNLLGSWLYTSQSLGLASLVFLVFYLCSLLWLIDRGRKGLKLPKLRRMGGIDAIDEAIGRATEMGRPVLYVPGIGAFVPDTFASFGVLGHVAKSVAKYDARMIVANCQVQVFPVTQSIVRQAYLEEGKPDAYREEDVRYITSDQFGFAAGVVGIMNREGVAAMVLLGTFYAESLIFAEAGNIAGAIQVAGTGMVAQIPFFVVACDYCLIGEEIYAAGAYLSQDKIKVGTLIAQDWGKQIVVILIALGTLAATVSTLLGSDSNIVIDLLKLY